MEEVLIMLIESCYMRNKRSEVKLRNSPFRYFFFTSDITAQLISLN
jgi:hypothetical protein